MKVLLVESENAEKFLSDLLDRYSEVILKKIEGRFKDTVKEEDLWVEREDAKRILGVRSAVKLQRLRDHNLIRTSRVGRNIRYFKPSLFEYLNRNIQK
jgi:hypothetical protein